MFFFFLLLSLFLHLLRLRPILSRRSRPFLLYNIVQHHITLSGYLFIEDSIWSLAFFLKIFSSSSVALHYIALHFDLHRLSFFFFVSSGFFSYAHSHTFSFSFSFPSFGLFLPLSLFLARFLVSLLFFRSLFPLIHYCLVDSYGGRLFFYIRITVGVQVRSNETAKRKKSREKERKRAKEPNKKNSRTRRKEIWIWRTKNEWLNE